jgi:hypothetical protein
MMKLKKILKKEAVVINIIKTIFKIKKIIILDWIIKLRKKSVLTNDVKQKISF